MTVITTVAIQPFALYDGELASNTTGTPVANTAYLVAAQPLRVPATLTGIRVRFNAGGAGHYDVGIYSDVNGVPTSLLGHSASSNTALVTATGVQTPALIGGNLALLAGRYWLALWIDNATDTITKQGGANNNMVLVQSGTNAGPLPAAASSLSGLANANFKPLLIGILLNGWT